jgi:hypothetical protein
VEVVIVVTGVHHRGEGGAPPWQVRCYCPNLPESRGNGVGHRQGTTVPCPVHRPNYPERDVFGDVGRGGTAAPCLVPQRLVTLNDRWMGTATPLFGDAPPCPVTS